MRAQKAGLIVMIVEVVVGILKRKGKVLVAERPKDKPYSGYWEFPGGKIEAHELPLNALRRELKEELEITVLKASPWFEYKHQYPDKTVLLKLWLVNEFAGEPHGNEQQTLRWVNYKELLQLHLLEGNKMILDKLASLMSTEHDKE